MITHTHHDHIAYINDIMTSYPIINIYCYKNSIHIKNQFIGLEHNEIIVIGNSFTNDNDLFLINWSKQINFIYYNFPDNCHDYFDHS